MRLRSQENVESKPEKRRAGLRARAFLSSVIALGGVACTESRPEKMVGIPTSRPLRINVPENTVPLSEKDLIIQRQQINQQLDSLLNGVCRRTLTLISYLQNSCKKGELEDGAYFIGMQWLIDQAKAQLNIEEFDDYLDRENRFDSEDALGFHVSPETEQLLYCMVVMEEVSDDISGNVQYAEGYSRGQERNDVHQFIETTLSQFSAVRGSDRKPNEPMPEPR